MVPSAGSGSEQTYVNGKTHWLEMENLMGKRRAHRGIGTSCQLLEEKKEKHCANDLL